MYYRGVKQVRTSSNAYSTVRYDKDGNILLETKAARKARNKAMQAARAKNKNKKKSDKTKWKKLTNKFENSCCICHQQVLVGEEIFWNIKSKRIKHVVH